MGNPVEPNGYELGTPCIPCMGLATPKRFLAIIQGVQKCDPAQLSINGFWVLEQAQACLWKGDANGVDLIYNAHFAAAMTSYFNALMGGWFFFVSIRADICTLAFSSGIVVGDCGPVFKNYGGTVQLLYGPGI